MTELIQACRAYIPIGIVEFQVKELTRTWNACQLPTKQELIQLINQTHNNATACQLDCHWFDPGFFYLQVRLPGAWTDDHPCILP